MKKIYALAFASGALLLGSCASDAPEMVGDQNTPNVEESGDGYYLRVNFGAGTRAASDFVASDATDGSGINNAAFVFFDADGEWISTRYIGYKLGTGQAGAGDDKLIDWVATTGHDANKCAVMKLTRVPAYVQCVINAHDEQEDVNSELENYDKQTWYRQETNGRYFTMSSANSYPEAKQGAKATYSTIIDAEKHLFTSKEAAESATEEGKEALQIYVEPIVAKVNVIKGSTLGTTVDVNSGENAEVEGGVVTFTPSYAFLTGWSVKANLVKALPDYDDLRTPLKSWTSLVGVGGHNTNWVDVTPTSITVSYAKMKDIKAGNDIVYDATAKSADRYKLTGSQVFYPFENNFISDAQNRTSIVVAGTYAPKDASGNDLAFNATLKAANEAWNEAHKNDAGFVAKNTDEGIGTFYLVGVGEKFTVYATENDAIQAAGGVAGTDKLVPEGVTNTAVDNNWKTWTGKMQIEGKPGLLKVIKYYLGQGYYSRTINRVTLNVSGTNTNFPAIVRNTEYTLSINSIAGMGVGIPTDETPIIPNIPTPNPKDEERYLHIGVNVNPWIKLDTQPVVWE